MADMNPKVISIGRMQMLSFLAKHDPSQLLKVYCDQEHEHSVRKALSSSSRPDLGVSVVERHQLDGMLDRDEKGGHGGVVIKCHEPEGMELERLIQLPVKGAQVLVVLDEIQDVHNLGAIARSTLLLGAQGLVFSGHRTASVTPGAIRASAGTLLLGRFSVVSNIARTLDDLKESGYWVGGLDARLNAGDKEELPFGKLAGYEKLALVVGGEHGGIRPLVRERCDFISSIPLVPAFQEVSLNASVALAVALASLHLAVEKSSR